MSAIGTPMPHIEPHFANGSDPYLPLGMCVCPCEECTTRTAHFCVCDECPCDGPEDHAVEL